MINSKTERIKELVPLLNRCCDEYYNGSTPSLSDAQYDALFDELSTLEKETGVILANSPTQHVGYEVLGQLEKVSHKTPLLSLAKTKDPADVAKLAEKGNGYLALKMDGLTVKLVYTDGVLSEASTRGDGDTGEIITHNARSFTNIPAQLPDGSNLTVTGEAFIDIHTFERINENIDDEASKYSTPRNLAAGSVRQLDARICKERGVRFMPFQVLDGFSELKSRSERLDRLSSLGFERIPSLPVKVGESATEINKKIFILKDNASTLGYPIDGIVFSYDNTGFATSLGRTAHHYRDGIAFKFGDPSALTTLHDIEWNISRTGQLTPVAVFEPVDIDNTVVERASLHNITFIENLRLFHGDKIRVSKRNMIIPHVEENLTADGRNNYSVDYPHICPVCQKKTSVETTENADKTVKVLYCRNIDCPGKQIKRFTHFVSKQALNIEGLSEQTLEKFMARGWLLSLVDIFSLSKHEDEILHMDGFGEKSFQNLCDSIEKARHTTLSCFLVSLNIGLIGKTNAAMIETYFNGDTDALITAIKDGFDFTQIDGIGEMMNNAIHTWFDNAKRFSEFCELEQILDIEKKKQYSADKNNKFFSKTVVITGAFAVRTRDELTSVLKSLGAKVTTSVSKKTDYVLCGENAGSKLTKAKQLGVPVLYESDLPF